MKRLIIILMLAMLGTQAQADKIDPKDEKLIRGVATDMSIVTVCQFILPPKADMALKLMYVGLDPEMMRAAMAKAKAQTLLLIEKIGQEKFCEGGRQHLKEVWGQSPSVGRTP